MKKYFIVICLLGSIISKAQPFSLGLKIEPFILFTELDNVNNQNIYSTSFYLQSGFKLSNSAQLEVHYGILLSEGYKFNGFQTCLMGKYFIRDGMEYIIGGYILHKNGGDNGAYYKTEDKYLSLGSLGIGTYLSKTSLYVQISYQFPINKSDFGYKIIIDATDPQKNSYLKNKLVGLIKLGIGYSFDL